MKNDGRYFKGKTILVTGGTGSIGSEIVKRLLPSGPKSIRVFSNDEDAQFNMYQDMGPKENIRFLLGDVRDRNRLARAMEGVDVVFHAAAFKHVPACEYNTFEAVQTNVIGTQNLIETALEEEVEKFITISTDKATSPINVLGASKLLAERLTLSANYYKGDKKTALSCVRFGNVMASRGSVIPIFLKQIEKGGPVTVTDPNMTRFVMSISQSVDLVLKAATMAKGGENFIFKMPALKIGDLARVMVDEYSSKYGKDTKRIKIITMGMRHGEKFHEELMTDEEARWAYETREMFILFDQVDIPNLRAAKKAVYEGAKKVIKGKKYSSHTGKLLSKAEIKETLHRSLMI